MAAMATAASIAKPEEAAVRIIGRMAVICLLLAPRIAGAGEAGDPQKGLAFAKMVCADCHAVQAKEEISPNIKAPSFAMIAKSGLVTKREIAAWIQSSHPDMPDFKLTPEQRADVTAYIESLAGGK